MIEDYDILLLSRLMRFIITAAEPACAARRQLYASRASFGDARKTMTGHIARDFQVSAIFDVPVITQ